MKTLIAFLFMTSLAFSAEREPPKEVTEVVEKGRIAEGEKITFTLAVAPEKRNVGFIVDRIDQGVEFKVAVQVSDDGIVFKELCRGTGVGNASNKPTHISCADRLSNMQSRTREFAGSIELIKGSLTDSKIDAVVQ